MKLIQTLALVAALAANAAAQTSGQATDPAAPSTAKPQPHQAATSADPKKKDSSKSSAASKTSAGTSGQSGGIKVIVPAKSTAQTTPSSTKNSGAKPAAQPASSSSTANTKKTTGPATGKSAQPTGAGSPVSKAQGDKTPASGSATNHAATAQKKQATPTLAVSPSRQAPGKNSTSKKAATGAPAAGKITQPKIVQKTPSKTSIVAAAKTSAKISSAGRRDPFVSPIRNAPAPTGPPVLNCSTGKKGLAIADLTVQGTAKDTDGKMMAIVAGGNHRSYFLRENDQICNGGVQKITADSVIFRESVTDSMGRQSTHEVVKKISPS